MFNANSPANSTVRNWQEAFEIGKRVQPKIAILPAVCFAYLAYDAKFSNNNDTAFYLYTFAAVIVPSIAPFTLIAMKENLATLNAKADAAKVKGASSAEEDKDLLVLLQKWQGLNWTRAVMVGAGAVAGAWATLM